MRISTQLIDFKSFNSSRKRIHLLYHLKIINTKFRTTNHLFLLDNCDFYTQIYKEDGQKI